MVIEDLEHVLAHLELFGVRRIVSPLRVAAYLAETRHRQLKTPITPSPLKANPTEFNS